MMRQLAAFCDFPLQTCWQVNCKSESESESVKVNKSESERKKLQ